MIKRSISMPVKPRYIEETPHLERSEEKEELYVEDDESENNQPFFEEFTSTARDNQSKGSSSHDSVHKSMFYLSDPSEISEATPPSDKKTEQSKTEDAETKEKSS